MNLKNLTLYIFLVFIGYQSIAQTDYNYYTLANKITKSDTSKLFLEVESNAFFVNNEFTNDIIKGYTLHGFNLSPKISYSPNSKIKFSGGLNVLSYYGRESNDKLHLLFSFQYKLLPKLDFVLGNIYGTVNHNMIEPLFDYERYYFKNIENGIQFLWNDKRISADLWLNWEQQIFSGDPFQEIFSVGLSSKINLINSETIELSIPFQNLVRHEGGQINSNKSDPVLTIYNNALGLSMNKSFDSKQIHDLTLSSYWVNYKDLSSTKEQMFIDGMGSYSTLELKNKNMDLMLGYWYGEQFISPIGNPIFETYSRTNIFVEEPIRKLITGKFNIHKEVYKGINLGARLGTYYDVSSSLLDYYWSIVVVMNGKFFLKQF